MSSYKNFFKDKKVLVVGLGANCEAVADIVFLIKAGAHVSMIDMRSEARIEQSVKKIQAAGMVACEFGTMARSHVEDKDIILKALDIPNTVPCIDEALNQDIPVETSSTLFLKMAPPIILIGVFGACGKTTTSYLINKVLSPQFNEKDGQNFWYIDQQSSQSPLNVLKKIKKGDVVLTSIREEQYDAYMKARISPHVAVVTNFTDVKLLEFQTYNNFLIANDSTVDAIKESNINIKAKILRTNSAFLPSSWSIHQPLHIKEDMALALRVAELFKIDFQDIQIHFETFKTLKGRLELCRNNIYNDAASVCPHSTVAALKTIGGDRDVVLILGGGANNDDVYELFQVIPKHVAVLILIPGSGTMKLHQIDITSMYATTIGEAVLLVKEHAKKGHKLLFSPAFLPQTTIRERSEQFVKALKEISLQL
jgi:UDP-N-acetylmuramoylalanine--D-glutamate ligase